MESPCAHNAGMPRPSWGVPLLLACGCSAGVARVVPAAVSPTPNVTAIWTVERADPGSRDVTVRFVAAACAAVRRVAVDEGRDRVVVTLDMAGREGKDCTEPLVRYRDVRLAAPLGSRALYDGGGAPPVLVRSGGPT